MTEKQTDVVVKDKFSDITKETWFNNKQIEVLKNTVFNTLKTESQVILSLKVAQKYQLDPFAKEFWSWVDNWWKLITVASASWFMKIARRQPWFISLQANAVYEWEDFSINTWNWEVNHVIKLDSRGKDKKPVGAYARLKMEWKEDVVKFVQWGEYAKETSKFNSPWNTYRNAMIEKAAVTVLCREAFWLSGLYWEQELDKIKPLNKQVVIEWDQEQTMKAIEEKEKEILWKTEEVEILDAETE